MRLRSGMITLGLAFALLGPSIAMAGTTGKISGRIVDKAKQPLAGANIVLVGAQLGAASDVDGRFAILNVPAGTVTVKIQLIGYKALTTTNLVVTADNTTRLDAVLEESVVAMAEIVVKATRPVIEVNQTSTIATVTREQLQALPVQELNDVVNLQAGVVDGHFRGGRSGEVQYQVDGVTVNNSYNNASSLKLDRSLLEEVQVISGTFDAEYGQALSGVVNAVLKSGTDKFLWDGEVLGGAYVYPGAKNRAMEYSFRPFAQQNYQLNLSGPVGLPRTNFLVSGRHYRFDSHIIGTRRFVPSDSADFRNKVFVGTGDDEKVPLGYSNEYSGVVKISNRSFNNIEIAYQAVGNLIDGRRAEWAFRLNPDGLSKQRTFSLVHGIDFTHTLSRTTYYSLRARQNYFDYHDWLYDNLYDQRYDAAGSPLGDADYEYGAVVQGGQFSRFKQNTNALVLKGSFSSQVTRDQQVKLGVEFQAPKLRFGVPGYLRYVADSTGQVLRRYLSDPPEFPGVQEYLPVQFAAYAQDELEWNDLVLRAGARFEFFDARSSLPSDLANPANSISGAPQSVPRATSNKFYLAPRVGISFPIDKRSALFFAYGHFYQMPPLGDAFTNADYSLLRDLQAGVTGPVMGNPDIRPEATVQYQAGYKNALSDDVGLDVTLFYKDIRDLLGVEFIDTYNGAQYGRLTNVDFGNVVGFTLSLDHRALGPLAVTTDYTWQLAEGNSSDPRETATRASAGEDPRPRLVPFNWDQRHTFNVTASLTRPKNYQVSAVLRAGSGQPYTPAIESGFGGGLETNSGHKPTGWTLDLRAEKSLTFAGLPVQTFARVFNLTDARYFNGFVFGNSGSPYYSRTPGPDAGILNDPTRFYAPRRIELGFNIKSPSK